MPRDSDYLMEEEIFLGGKISAKYKDYAAMAMLSPDYAEMFIILTRLPEWQKIQDKLQVILEMVKALGMVDFIRTCSELTRLSMILGDTREETNVKKVIDELRKTGQDSST